jgi:hypothetical protein
MMTPAKLCPIPKDLKPGDKLRLRNGTVAIFDAYDNSNYPINCFYNDGGICLSATGAYWSGGEEHPCDCVGIIRAKPPKPDRDAAWLLAHLATASDDGDWLGIQTGMSEVSYNRRIRAIAKRLNGGELPCQP